MTTTAAAVYAPVARYAERLHAVAGDTHHIASPLGAWLLLALAATASSGPVRDDLTEALGAGVDDAAAVAATLLGASHAAVLSAAATWTRPGIDAEAFSRRLPATVETGDLPDQAGLDTWARERTLGLIERFPLTLGPDTLLVLATALATRVSWDRPFDLAPASDLGRDSAWAGRLGTVLRTPEGHGHRQFIAATEQAGDVAVHTAEAREGLHVTSVIAAPGVPAADVLAAAYEVAEAGRGVVRRSLFDLPLGEGPLWTLSERRTETTAPDGREERCTAVLPAWSAQSDLDLTPAELGFPAAAQGLAELLGLRDYGYDARQSAVARYTRIGFEAAAVSAMMVATSYTPPRDGVVRVADLRFGHPYAVVAVATDRKGGPWHGMPVFSAWVADPQDAET